MNLDIIKVTVLFVAIIGTATAMTCYDCDEDDVGGCVSPTASTATVDCTGQCYTKIRLESGIEYRRGCKTNCLAGTSVEFWDFSYWSFDDVHTTCCDGDNCNDIEKPAGYTKCHECDGVRDVDIDHCVDDLTYADIEICAGKCAKYDTKTEFLGQTVKTVRRECANSCTPGKSTIFGSTVNVNCCEGDLCNAGNRLPLPCFALLVALAALAKIVLQ